MNSDSANGGTGHDAPSGDKTVVHFRVEGATISVSLDHDRHEMKRSSLARAREALDQVGLPAAAARPSPRSKGIPPNAFASWAYRQK